MSVCVNISSKEFKDTAKRLNISEGSLENIVHQFINSEGNENSFPSDSYILSKVEGQPFTEALSEKAQKLVDLKYSKPITVETYNDAKAVMNDMAQYFDSKHIGLKETLDGKYEVSLNTKVDPNFKETVSAVQEVVDRANVETQTSVEVDENNLSVPQSEQVRPELSKFQNETSKIITQLNNLLDSSLMSNAEVKHVAEQAVYYISDIITEFQETPEKVSQIFPELFVKDGNPMTDEEKSAQIEKIKQMDRREFVNYVTLQRLINYTRDNLFSPAGNSNIKSLDLRHKAKLIRDNFDGIIRFANDAFVIVENFPIKFNGDVVEVGENVDLTTEENYDNDNNVDNLRDDGESLQEHWQVESRTRDVMTSMSQLVRSALNKCFQVEIVDGKEVPVTSEFGIKERVNAKDATSSILRWTRGAESLSHMIQLLENKVTENPWVKQIVEKLKDTSGKEADFQSQFFGVFAKAFQSYSVILKEKDSKTNKYTYKSIQVNQHPALTDVTQSIEVAFKTGMHPLFDGDRVRKDTLETFDAIVKDLTDRAQKKLEENNRNEVVDLLVKATNVLGYAVEPELVNLALDNNDTFHNMVNRLNSISDNLNKATTQQNYDPFKFSKFKGDNSIGGYLADFLRPITEKLEETAVSSFYDSGKMYQSYVTPSYLTVLMNHFTSEDNRFQEWLENEYGQYEWFRNTDGSWRNTWLETLDQMGQEDRKKLFKHKVQLNFNKHNYMKNMSDTEYGLSILAEYFSEMGSVDGSQVPVWFRVPMMSNKPSSEFIRMYAYTGSLMKYMLLEGFNNIFQQELSRIQTVEIRDYNESNPNFIKNFDKNGKKFIMLDFLNKYLKDGAEVNSELGKLLDKAIKDGTEKLTPEQNSQLNSLVNTEIEKFMDAKADAIISEWKSNGIFEGAKQIANIGTEDSTVETKLREFIWNDTFASMNILELTITDPAYYKDAEDLQKRLAQIHAPGTRANVEAIDYEGKKVTDGKFRTVLLKDFDDFVSNIKDNLRVVFDRKLGELEKSGLTKEDSRYKAAAAVYESIIKQFDEINVADAQGYSSPTSYRKKAFIFGRWSKQAEDIYQKLKKGNYNYNDLQTAFQPLKPFVYGQIEKPSIDSNRNDIARPLNKLKVPVQFKNSEYLLIMADAILQNEDTGKPNLLRAIYEVMEESAENDNTRGIDTIQFESTCKSGLMAPIDIKQFYDAENGEFLAKKEITDRIYNSDGTYSSTYVYEVPFENYAIQQEVPEHFKNHEQAHGSQIRYIIPSDLESVDSDGNPVTYNYFDRGEEKHLNREEFRKEYEDNISQNIEESLKALSKELCLDSEYYSRRDRNIALSRLLLQEIWNSPRYGVELAIACSVNDETGEFNIPLGDPVQSKRVEQLINSIVKNNVNKQEIAGGPVVQVTNFGTSRQLNIRFNSKEGGLLMTRDEFEKSGKEGTYEDYITKNQAGIAYFEVFAPIFSNELFENFADKNGNIDIETIEKINPDLLKMIGYRIPTEDKYSMAPLKIVGFLPREAGDGIMLPNDITLLTGSDFDVDKFYLMRKDIPITHKFLGDMNSAVIGTDEYIQKHKNSLRKELIKRYRDKYDLGKYKLSDVTKGRLEERADLLIEEEINSTNELYKKRQGIYQYRVDALNRQKNDEISVITKVYNRDVDALEEQYKNQQVSEEDYNKRMDELDQTLDEDTKKVEDKYQAKIDKIKVPQTNLTENQIAEIRSQRPSLIYDLARSEQEKILKETINSFLEDPFKKASNTLEQQIKDIYVEYMFDYVDYTDGTIYRNNKIIDMSWAVLTNETTASKMLTPGGFEPEKRMGYLISAYQNPAVNFTWEQLNAIENIKDLKNLCYTDKNLCFIDTHLQFYKQNSAAATALGMAAVQKVAHAVLESDGYSVDVNDVLNFEDEEFFEVAGKKFFGRMELDGKYNDEGNLIGRTLGEFVAMFADAVKDPVANLMNINNTTMPIVTCLIRLGMPFEKVALFISQPIIRRVLSLYNSENITNFVSLADIIQRELDNIEKDFNIEDDSKLKELNVLTEEELVNNLKPTNSRFDTDYKILTAFQYFDKISKSIKALTYTTRFNSISNAVGPLVIDNLMKEYKMEKGDFSNIYNKAGDSTNFYNVLNNHPILGSFYKTVDMARQLLDDMPVNSNNFRQMLSSADEDIQKVLLNDKKTLGELSNFYQSYLLVASGAIPVEATKENPHQGLKYYIEKFPADFMKANAKELFKGNALIDAIRLDIQNGKAVLKINTAGLTTQDKEKLGDGWADLYRSGERGRKLAEHLFYYNFWRTGIAFNPKSFMGLVPVRIKNHIPGYNDSFIVHSNTYAENVNTSNVLRQFVRNNADNNKLVPRVKLGKDGVNPQRKGNVYTFSDKDYSAVKDKYYIKIKSGNRDILLERYSVDKINGTAIYTELSLLGNNGEYFEAFVGSDYTPLSQTLETKEQKNDGELAEVSNNEVQLEGTPETSPTVKEQSKRAIKIRNMLLKMFMSTGKTEEQAKAKMEEFKNKSSEEKNKYKKQMKDFIKNKFDKFGIKYDDALVEEMYNELC